MSYLELPQFFAAAANPAVNVSGNHTAVATATGSAAENDQAVAQSSSFSRLLLAGEAMEAENDADIAPVMDQVVDDGDANPPPTECAVGDAVVLDQASADPQIAVLSSTFSVSSTIAGDGKAETRQDGIAKSDSTKDSDVPETSVAGAVWLGWDLFMDSRAALNGTGAVQLGTSSATTMTGAGSADPVISTYIGSNPTLSPILTTGDSSLSESSSIANAEGFFAPAVSSPAAMMDASAIIAMADGKNSPQSLAVGSVSDKSALDATMTIAPPSLADSSEPTTPPVPLISPPNHPWGEVGAMPTAEAAKPLLAPSTVGAVQDGAIMPTANGVQSTSASLEPVVEPSPPSTPLPVSFADSSLVTTVKQSSSSVETTSEFVAQLKPTPTTAARMPAAEIAAAAAKQALPPVPFAEQSASTTVATEVPITVTPVFDTAQKTIAGQADRIPTPFVQNVEATASTLAAVEVANRTYSTVNPNLPQLNDEASLQLYLADSLKVAEPTLFAETDSALQMPVGEIVPVTAKVSDAGAYSGRSISINQGVSTIAAAPPIARSSSTTDVGAENLQSGGSTSGNSAAVHTTDSADSAHAAGLSPATNPIQATPSRSETTTSPISSSPITDILDLQQSHWGRTLGRQLSWMVNNRMQEASIQVNPPDLGPVEIRVSLQHNQTNVTFFCHEAAVREAIENAMPKLREMLNSQGISLNQAQVSDQSLPRQQAGFAEQQLSDRRNGGDRSAMAASDQNSALNSDSDAIERRSRSLGIVDHYV